MSELPPILQGSNDRGSSLSGALSFHGRARDIFSRNGLLALLCGISVVGIPYAGLLYYRWTARNTETVNGNKFIFTGGLWTLYGLSGCQVLTALCFRSRRLREFYGHFHSSSGIFAAMIALLLLQSSVNGMLGFLYLRYFFTNVEDTQHKKINFEVPFLRYVAFSVLVFLSLFTIIGWAWCAAWLYRWIFKNLRLEGATIHFNGTGFSFLWRTIVFAVCCAPVVTAPWSIVWFSRWLISSVEIRHESRTASAIPVG
jgi:hypothetical protein